MMTDIVGIVLAVIGVIIAVLQFRIDKRESKKEEEKEQERQNKVKIMESIVEKTNCLEDLDDLLTKAKATTGLNEKDMGELFNHLQNICLMYKKSYKEIGDIYYQLVKNESEFSLSYGYGRYIDVFRDYLLFSQEMDKVVNDIFAMDAIAKKNAEAQRNGEEVDISYFDYRNHAIETMKLLDVKLTNVKALIEEIKIKYTEEEPSQS